MLPAIYYVLWFEYYIFLRYDIQQKWYTAERYTTKTIYSKMIYRKTGIHPKWQVHEVNIVESSASLQKKSANFFHHGSSGAPSAMNFKLDRAALGLGPAGPPGPFAWYR